MLRLCVLGNSHVAALKNAITPELEQRLGIQATFFAHRQDGLLGLSPWKTGLKPDNDHLRRRLRQTSGGDGVVRYADYDAFCICGADPWMGKPFRYFRKQQPLRFRLGSEFPLISEPAFRSLITESYANSVAAYLLPLVKTAGKPVFLMPSPMTSVDIGKRPYNKWMKLPGAMEAVAWLRGIVVEESTTLAARHGVELVLQPDDTFDERGFTKVELSRGWGPHPGELDGSHMNGAYGTLMLEALVSRLK